MRRTTAQSVAEFTSAMTGERVPLHYGPGPHSDGSPQSIHAGGAKKPLPKSPRQTRITTAPAQPPPSPAKDRPAPRVKPLKGQQVTVVGESGKFKFVIQQADSDLVLLENETGGPFIARRGDIRGADGKPLPADAPGRPAEVQPRQPKARTPAPKTPTAAPKTPTAAANLGSEREAEQLRLAVLATQRPFEARSEELAKREQAFAPTWRAICDARQDAADARYAHQDSEDAEVYLAASRKADRAFNRAAKEERQLSDARAALEREKRAAALSAVAAEQPNEVRASGPATKQRRIIDEFLAPFRASVDKRALSEHASANIEFVYNPTPGRAFYSVGSGTITLYKGNDERVVTHEVGHWLENRVPGAGAAARDFIQRRTAGQSAVALAELHPGAGYDPGEMTRQDSFIDPYIGRVGLGTEAISMGLQYYASDPATFARKDPEHFRLIARIVRPPQEKP